MTSPKKNKKKNKKIVQLATAAESRGINVAAPEAAFSGEIFPHCRRASPCAPCVSRPSPDGRGSRPSPPPAHRPGRPVESLSGEVCIATFRDPRAKRSRTRVTKTTFRMETNSLSRILVPVSFGKKRCPLLSTIYPHAVYRLPTLLNTTRDTARRVLITNLLFFAVRSSVLHRRLIARLR